MNEERGETRTIETRDDIKVVTDNKLITAFELSRLSLKGRKLLYLVMAQCKQTDDKFYIYEITPAELAEKLNVGRNHVYELADELTRELMGRFIEVKQLGAKRFKKYTVFSMCEYDDKSVLRFKLNPDMTDFLLKLKKNFTQTVLADYLKMRSPYSMAIWHLMQREMHGQKPGTERIDFYLSLEELRIVTGTENKFKQTSQFKQFVLNRAIKEIDACCGVTITYEPRRRGRFIDGYYFTARGLFDLTDYEPPREILDKLRMFELGQKVKEKTITRKEYDELQGLIMEHNQMTLFDYDVE